MVAAALPDARFGPLLAGTPKGDIRHLVPDARARSRDGRAGAAGADPVPALRLCRRRRGRCAPSEAFVRLTQASTNYVALGEAGFAR